MILVLRSWRAFCFCRVFVSSTYEEIHRIQVIIKDCTTLCENRAEDIRGLRILGIPILEQRENSLHPVEAWKLNMLTGVRI